MYNFFVRVVVTLFLNGWNVLIKILSVHFSEFMDCLKTQLALVGGVAVGMSHVWQGNVCRVH